eukprot:1158398-Pelagomonas_calceolata.AAC.1
MTAREMLWKPCALPHFKRALGASPARLNLLGSMRLTTSIPRRFPNKQRLLSSRPDAILVQQGFPMKTVPRTNSRYPLRSRGGRRGNREHAAPATATPPTSKVRHLVSSFQNRGTSISWRSNTVKTPGPRISRRPPSNSTVTSVAIFQGAQLKSPSMPFF